MAACFHPITIRAPGRGGINSTFTYYQVPCGKCPACLKRRQQDWSIRIQHETDHCLSNGGSTYFVTLTYRDEDLPRQEWIDYETGEWQGFIGDTLCYPDVQKFLHNIRQYFERSKLGSFRYFCCGEYGDSFMRPHYHIMLWLNFKILADDLLPLIKRFWTLGDQVTLAPFSVRRSEYIAKYSTKRLSQDYTGITPPFAKMSLKPAIGSWFIDKNRDFYRSNQMFHTYDSTGVPFALPRYYKNRIFDLSHIDAYTLQLEAKYWALYDARTLFNPRWELEQRQALRANEDNFFRKLRNIKLGISTL